MTDPIDPLSPCGYASIHDYEIRTGATVPVELYDTYCAWLTDNSALIELYLGPCAEPVAAAYPDVLAMLTVQRTQRMASIPQGVSSTSVGGTSVTFVDGAYGSTSLWPAEADLLDRLMNVACGEAGGPNDVAGLGQLGVAWGGPAQETPDELWVTVTPQPSRVIR
jgi:hypothetical protein